MSHCMGSFLVSTLEGMPGRHLGSSYVASVVGM